ncbi:MAG: hypothetical protein R3C53_10270 [Pirellulaceae bacterium]
MQSAKMLRVVLTGNQAHLHKEDVMATLKFEKSSGSIGEQQFIDMETIRRRVAKIKNRWSPETAKARAIEGVRRRADLEALLSEIAEELECENEAELAGSFGLVG